MAKEKVKMAEENEEEVKKRKKLKKEILASAKKRYRKKLRKKILNLDLIEDTNKTGKFEGKKPAKLYKFKDVIESKKVF